MTTTEQRLHFLASHDPDYPAFAAAMPSEVLRTAAPLPEGFTKDVADLLRAERPELAALWDAPPPGADAGKLGVDPLPAVLTLSAVLFLLRSHIRIDIKGFHYEHKPMDSELLKKVMAQLGALLGNKPEA